VEIERLRERVEQRIAIELRDVVVEADLAAAVEIPGRR